MNETEYDKAIELYQNGEIDSLIEKIDSTLKDKPELEWQLRFATLYLDCAEILRLDKKRLEDANILVTKTLQIYKKYSAKKINSFLVDINTARAFGIKYDINYIKNQIESNFSGVLDYTNVKSIYDIEDYLTDSIKLYRSVLQKYELDKIDEYSIQNNLAQHLSRTGRYIESLELYEKNTIENKDGWQSFASYGDCLHTLTEISFIPSTASLHLNICENYFKAQALTPHLVGEQNIQINIEINKSILRQFGFEVDEKTIKANRIEEKEEFETLNSFRKFVINNSLSLNEHSLYCKCKDAQIDNLKIGTLIGSSHIHESGKFEILDGYVNRILSEFCYSRSLFVNYFTEEFFDPKDVDFSEISIKNDDLGYEIEQLRSSYRLTYGVLDKIMNGVLVLYDFERGKDDYFESFFFRRRKDFEEVSNIHLAALFSFAIELDQSNGVFKDFKKTRNLMEHEFFPISKEDSSSMTLGELKLITFELLKLTRCAIFSFVFLIRSETIVEK